MLLSDSKMFRIKFLSLKIWHKSKCSFILININTYLLFKEGEPPLTSKVVSRKILKSQSSIICLFW